jgi:hypothetical protein
MANATAITLTAAGGHTKVTQPTADVLDTGTAAVTLPLALAGVGADRVLLEVKNTAANALKVEILAGDSPPALRASLGDLTLTAALAQNGVEMFGPFESARFLQNDATSNGRLDFKFTPASGTIGVTIRAYRLPKTV